MRIDRKEAIKSLEPLKSAIAARADVPELNHVWFDGTHVYAHDRGFGIRIKAAFPLKCGVPGNLLFGMLGQSSADSLEFEVDENQLSFKSGRSSVKLNTLPLTQKLWRWPETPNSKPLATITVSEDLISALKRLLAIKASNPQRMEHHAVCIFGVEKNKEMDLYTIDTKSLTLIPVAEPIIGTANRIALPRKMAEQVAARCAPGKKLHLYVDHFAVDASDKLSLYSNQFDTSNILDLPSYVDRFTENEQVFDWPDSMSAALERAVLMAGDEDPVVVLRIFGKSLKLSGRYKLGQVDEDFTLTAKTSKSPYLESLGHVPKAGVTKEMINVDAKTLLSIRDIKKLAITSQGINLYGDDGFQHFRINVATDTATADE